MDNSKNQIFIRPLGLFRFCLALSVLVHHFGINFLPSLPASYVIYLQPGTIGVYIFLFLSSYIIMTVAVGPYFDKPLGFIKNRALRILPELFLSLIFAIGVQYFLFNYGYEAERYYVPTSSDAFSLHNIAMNFLVLYPYPNPITTWDFVIVFWSVKYEIIFYLLVFIYLALTKNRVVVNKLETFEITMAVSCLFVITVNFFGGLAGPHLFMAQIFTFLACGSLYFLVREGNLFRGNNEIFSLAFIFGALAWNTKNITGSNPVVLIFCALIIASIFLLECRVNNRKYKQIDHLCGDMSYTIFLFHVPIGSLVRNYVGVGWPTFIIASVISLILSYVICKSMRGIFAPLRNKIRGRSLD